MTFTELGARIDDWLDTQRFRWIRLRRRLPGYRPPPVSEFATIWSEDIMATCKLPSTFSNLIDRSFEDDMKFGKTISISRSNYGDEQGHA